MQNINWTDGGVCAPEGFKASGIHCGIRRNRQKKDLCLIAADRLCTAAAVYTTNKVKGAPVLVTRRHLSDGRAQAIVCNSGNANTCNADGIEKAQGMCGAAAQTLGIAPDQVIVASTGVIGQPLDIEPMRRAMPRLAAQLSRDGSGEAARAIMTTDTVEKQAAVSFQIDGVTCRIGGIAKGSGMIHPNMATMLAFLTTDVQISPDLLRQTLKTAVDESFHMLSIDGDTSTNDMVAILASGGSGAEVRSETAVAVFSQALTALCVALARRMAKDGEGATRLLACRVEGASELDAARALAKSVVCSSLVKAAVFGADANWGRVLCALGYADAALDPAAVDVSFFSEAGRIAVCRAGAGVAFDEARAKEILQCSEVTVDVRVGSGPFEATAWGCDLTYDYVKINGDYRT